MMEINESVQLPNWINTNLLMNIDDKCVNKQKWRRHMISAIVYLVVAIIMFESKEDDISRVVLSYGFEFLGEYVNKVGNIGSMILVCQYMTCQLVNYQTFRLNNMIVINKL